MGLRGRDRIRLWAVPILLAGVALAFDAADRRVPFSVLASGALDEVAHLATGALGLLALACFIDPPGRFYVAGLIASVAIDLDHIPLYLGLGNPGQRPVTHSLTTVLVIVVAAVLSRRHRAVLAGAATGLLIHFARDIAEGPPGVRILWPLQNTAWTATSRWFLGMIIAFTVVRLVLSTVGLPRTRIRLYQPPAPASSSSRPTASAASADRDPDPEAAPYQSPQSPVRAEHVRAVVDDLTPRVRYLRLNIRPNPRAADVWRAAMPAGAHRVARMAHAIDLDGGFDTVWHNRL